MDFKLTLKKGVSMVLVASMLSSMVGATTVEQENHEVDLALTVGEQAVAAQTPSVMNEKVELLSFTQMVEKWNYLLVGGSAFSLEDADIKTYVDALSDKAKGYYNSMEKKGEAEDTRTYLWEHLDINDTTIPANGRSSRITMSYDQLKFISLAYKTKGTEFYQNKSVLAEIIAAYEMMATVHYKPNAAQFGNWFDWRIGTPLRYLDGLAIMYDEFTTEQLLMLIAPVKTVIDAGNFTSAQYTGANMVWKQQVITVYSLLNGYIGEKTSDEAKLLESTQRMNKMKVHIKAVFSFVTKGDGFYQDGSFIQHEYFPYTGGYGKALLVTMAPLMNALKDSAWELKYDDGAEKMFYDMLFKAYEPFVYKGVMMDMVRNREISRSSGEDNLSGRQVIRSFVYMIDALEGEQKKRCESAVKFWLENDPNKQIYKDPIFESGFVEYYVYMPVLLKAKAVASDAKIKSRGELVEHIRYPSMDRVVHGREDFTAGLAMHSDRVRTFEVVNSEGTNMWHTADGMLYLYNKDLNQYANDFWGTIDHGRLPGTTVDKKTKAGNYRASTANKYNWVGGTDMDGLYGVSGIHMDNGVDSKKSYFFFDDEIVAVGAGITDTSGAPVETVVENRKLKDDKSNVFKVNGVELQIDAKESEDTVLSSYLSIVDASQSASGSATVAFTPDDTKPVTIETRIRFPQQVNFYGVKLLDDTNTLGWMFVSNNKNFTYRTLDGGNKDTVLITPHTSGWYDIKIVSDPSTKTSTITITNEDGGAYTGALPYSQAAAVAPNKVQFFTQGKDTYSQSEINVQSVKVTSDGEVLVDEDFTNFNVDTPPTSTTNSWSISKAVGITSQVQQIIKPSDKEHILTDVSYAHLAGNVAGSDIGYYFPQGTDLKAMKETRTQKWTLMNNYEKFLDNKDRTGTFATVLIDHGNSPQNASYEYVLLPNKTDAQTGSYSENPDIEVLENTPQIHAVREKNLKITGINFWNDEDTYASFHGVTVDKKASVMIKEKDGGFALSVADPTQKNTGKITVEMLRSVKNVVSKSEGITVLQTSPTLKLEIDVNKSVGKSFYAEFTNGDVDSTQVFGQLRTSWKNYLTGGSLPSDNASVNNYVANLDTEANSLFDSMTKNASTDRTYLWDDLDITYIAGSGDPARVESAKINSVFTRLKTLALAFSTEGCMLYKSAELKTEIIAGWDLMVDKHYNPTSTMYGNWYHWEIGAPIDFLSGVLMLCDDLSEAQIKKYTDAVNTFTPVCNKGSGNLTSPKLMTGANLMDKAVVVGMVGVLTDNPAKLAHIKDNMKPVFNYVTTGDGFYKDGSYIQHDAIAYTAGYGSVLFGKIGQFISVFQGSPWALAYDDHSEYMIYDMIFEAIEPVLYDGLFMDMTRSRGVTRVGSSDKNSGTAILSAIMPFGETMPTVDMKNRFNSMIKYYVGLDEAYFYENCNNVFAIKKAQEIMKNQTIAPRSKYMISKNFGSMDKTVHIQKDYAFSVSMHSTRTYPHEFVNQEGKQTWNMADGMTYLYNGDKEQYGDAFWATVDPTRLPGITSESVIRADGVGGNNYNGNRLKGSYAWVGGATLGAQYSATGMQLKTFGNTTAGGTNAAYPNIAKRDGTDAKKSWFMFDNEIVAIGSGITSTTGNTIETVIENRKINDTTNVVTIEGETPDITTDVAGTTTNYVNWMHLAGNEAGEDIGYYLPTPSAVKALKETRTKDWFSNGAVAGAANNSFATLWFDHGTNPTDARYEYVLLPGKTAEQTEAYSQNADIEILSNTNDIHGARDNQLGVMGLNIWNDNITTFVGGIRADKKASITAKMEAEHFTVAIADPTQLNTGKITVEVQIPSLGFETEEGSKIEVLQTFPTTIFTVDVNKAAGRSLEVSFKKSPIDNSFETCTLGEMPTGWSGAGVVVVNGARDSRQSLEVSANGSVKTAIAMDNQGGLVEFDLKGNGIITLLENETEKIAVTFEGGMVHYDGEEIGTYDSTTWQHIKVRINSLNNSFSLYVEDQKQLSKKAFEKGTLNGLAITAKEQSVQIDNVLTTSINNTPPSIPNRLTYTAYGSNFVDLQWDAATDDVSETVTYLVCVGEHEPFLVEETNFRVMGLIAETPYSIAVIAVDEDENQSEKSEPLTLTTDVVLEGFESFDGMTEGKLTEANGWKIAGTGTDDNSKADIVNSPTGEQGNNCLYVGSTDTKSDKKVDYTFDTIQSGIATFRFKVLYDAWVNSSGVHIYNHEDKPVISIMTTSSGIGHRPQSSQAITLFLRNFIFNSWMDLVVEINVDNSTYSLWINGEKVVIDAGTRYPINAENITGEVGDKGLAKIQIAAPNSYTGGFYFDELELPGISRSNINALPTIEGKTVSYNTDFYALDLPTELTVGVDGDETATVRVNWNKDDYKATQSGVQTMTGTLAYGSSYANTNNLAAKLDVTVGNPPSSGSGGSEVITYTVSFDSQGGSAVSSVKAESGKTITKPADPTKEGFVFDGWYTDSKGMEAYDFGNKATKNTTLYAKWTEKKTAIAFGDVEGHWAKEHIYYLAERGIVKGISETSFAPNNSITRAEFVKILANIAKMDPSKTAEMKFADVKEDDWFAKEVAWANATGITGGMGNGLFMPAEKITREQMAVMLSRFTETMKYDVKGAQQTVTFADQTAISAYAKDAVETMQKAGIINGKDDNNFDPAGTATRGECAKMIALLLQTTKN